jgi:DNA-binding CsgD family transcriptional regulator
VFAGLGRTDEAVSVLERAESEARRRQGRALLWRIFIALGQAELARSSRAAASAAFANARAIVSEIAATLPDAPIPELGIASAREQFIAATDGLMPTQRPPTALKAAKQSYDGLTARERDVASLIARGMSNRAIANELIVSERTVASHVANILSKLVFSSRSQIAVWATEKGLTRPGGEQDPDGPTGSEAN